MDTGQQNNFQKSQILHTEDITCPNEGSDNESTCILLLNAYSPYFMVIVFQKSGSGQGDCYLH